MSDVLLPLVFATVVWWASTGVILWLVRLPERTFPTSVGASVVLLVVALGVLSWSSTTMSPLAVYAAFAGAIAVWGVQELAFLTGYVTGPRQSYCPAGCTGWRHFRHGAEALLYHELLLVVLAAMVAAVTWGGPNQVGGWTFLVLWLMRLSAKLNLFLGVPNLGSELLPERLRYLESFLSKRPMNALFPLAVTAATLALGLMVSAIATSQPGEPATIGLILIATLLGLAILEHWFMVLPMRSSQMWQWALDEPAKGTAHQPCANHQHDVRHDVRQGIDILKTPAAGVASN